MCMKRAELAAELRYFPIYGKGGGWATDSTSRTNFCSINQPTNQTTPFGCCTIVTSPFDARLTDDAR